MESTVDKSNQTVSAQVEHFSIYAIRAVPAAFNWIPIVVSSLLVEVIIGVGVVLYIHYRRGGAVRKASGPPLLLPPIAGGQYVFPSITEQSQEGANWKKFLSHDYHSPPGTKSNPSKEN